MSLLSPFNREIEVQHKINSSEENRTFAAAVNKEVAAKALAYM
jgi:hypothetical protein